VQENVLAGRLPHRPTLPADAAIRLRRWDDAAKVAGLALPPLRSFSDLMRSQMDAAATATKAV
jgi:hypothetical protein